MTFLQAMSAILRVQIGLRFHCNFDVLQFLVKDFQRSFEKERKNRYVRKIPHFSAQTLGGYSRYNTHFKIFQDAFFFLIDGGVFIQEPPLDPFLVR